MGVAGQPASAVGQPSSLGGVADAAVPSAALAAAAEAAAIGLRDLSPMLRRIEALVRIDSGSDAPVGRELVADLLEEWATAAGCEVEFVPDAGGTTLVARLRGNGHARVALIGHHDTIYPAGTAAARGFVLQDDRCIGPGAADMKGGLVLALAALEVLASGERPFASVELHSSADEESRPQGAFATLDRVRGADAALVLECARENGDLVVERKSQCNLRLIAHGRSAHAGAHPERGQSALLALCREVLRCDALTGHRDGLTVTVGTFHSGTAFGMVPDEAEAELDIRAWATSDVVWALEQVRATSAHEGVALEVDGVSLWPALAPTAASRQLHARAAAIGAHLDTPVGARRSGGASDGCWTSGAGVPTLDGLGPIGGHDHSPEEYIEVSSLPERCGLLVGLITALGLQIEERAARNPTAKARDGASER
jgi:glutamate carboxypeptidase